MPRIPLLLILLTYFIFTFLTYQDFGITTDEKNVYTRGELLYKALTTRDNKLLTDNFLVNTTSTKNHMYNNFYAMFLHIFNQESSYEVYHLYNMLFSSLFLIIAYELALAANMSVAHATIGTLMFLITPRLFGHFPANPKDIPFALFYFLSIASIYWLRKRNDIGKFVLLGIVFAITASFRAVGLTLYIIFIVFELWPISIGNIRSWVENRISHLFVLSLTSTLIYMVMLPYVGAFPLLHFPEILLRTSNFPWEGNVVYLGEVFVGGTTPWHYLPVMLLVTTPLFILMFFTVGLFARENRFNPLWKLLIIAFSINITLFLILQPVIYNGIRHALFLLPLLLGIALFGFVALCKWRIISYGFFVIQMVIILNQYITLHPFQYTYFNELVGNTVGAYSSFDTEYWTASSKYATEWLVDHIKSTDDVDIDNPIKVYTCSHPTASYYYFPEWMVYTDTLSEADFALCWNRYNDLEKIDGEIIHTIQRQGVTFQYIVKINT